MADSKRSNQTARVVVIGLGRFGSSLARELARGGYEVLGIDADPRRVQSISDDLMHAVVADTTDEEALRQLDVPEFERAVVAIGSNLEASILTTSLLVDFGIPHIWAKATNRQQGRILERIGAHHVVLPEHDMGERVAHLVTGRMLDFIEFEDDYAIVKTLAPVQTHDVALGESRLRTKYGVTVVGVKRPGEGFTYATAETIVRRGDVLIVAGKTAEVEAVANLQ
ncbi:potassium channel family protein [Kribbella deserti]|uniref:Potassium channel family protein n=1 Tax=Kribbella deserti TaxID=1926257 RepID=A0ABV6QHS9_9ACTN